MNENIKNWLIGGLTVLVIFLGFNYFKNNSYVDKNQSISQIETINQSETINNESKNIVSKSCISPQEAWNKIGQTECVEFYVESPYRSSKGNIFLNEKKDYKNGFTVWIPSASVSNFSEDPMSMYGYKTIQVTGLIRMYKGKPEIIANSQSEITVVK